MDRIPRSVGLFLFVAALCAGCEVRDVPPAGEAGHADGRNPATLHDGVAGRITFVEDFESGIEMSRSQQKPLLLFFTATWCKYCQQMAKETLVHEAVVDLSRNFICVLIDADADPDVCREFDVRTFPTVQFVSPKGVRIQRVTGKQPTQQFVAQMRAALQAISRRRDLTIER